MTNKDHASVGWIGTGVMGAPMAGHLQAAGHPLHIYTRSPAKAQALLDAGATWHETPTQLAAASDVVCTMVGFPNDVRETILGDDGVLAGLRPGSLLIDLTTSSPALAVEIAEAGASQNVDCLDAPVSGGDIGARAGSLSIMVGGSPGAFARAEPLLQHLGNTIILQGPAGSGQHTKMVNQTVIAGTMIGICEALLYAQHSGLDPAVVLQSIGGGAASSWGLTNLYPRALAGDYDPGFYIEHFVKDMGIALEESERMGLNLPGLSLVRGLYQGLIDAGHGRLGTQALVKALATLPA